jgi:hypothetical protein
VYCCVALGTSTTPAGVTERLKTLSPVSAITAESAVALTEIVCGPVPDGAVYKPLELIVPMELLPPVIPSTNHVKLGFESPCAEAVYCCVAPGTSATSAGVTERLKTVTDELALAVVEATLTPTV